MVFRRFNLNINFIYIIKCIHPFHSCIHSIFTSFFFNLAEGLAIRDRVSLPLFTLWVKVLVAVEHSTDTMSNPLGLKYSDQVHGLQCLRILIQNIRI